MCKKAAMQPKPDGRQSDATIPKYAQFKYSPTNCFMCVGEM